MISSTLGKGAMRVVYILEAFAALAVGMMFFNIDLFASLQANIPMLVAPLRLLFGAAGLAGLAEAFVGCGECCN